MTTQDITFRTRKRVRPEDLHADGTLIDGTLIDGTLFGGSLLRRSGDEGAAPAAGGHGHRRAARGTGR
ncbi:hypothetical protein RCG67_16140 [Kocuria sp. CPCC 205292]|uniref:hypothetical protein n=1 Tax=Kocuria cellulosilytica TaxID=3071451 RepID=UPI0034D50ECB